MIGKKFGRLTIISNAPNRGHYKYFLCLCDCGKTKEVYRDSLLRGSTKSCGCLQKERARDTKLIHGFASGNKHKLYRIWAGMNNRCTCKSNSSYERYGGRGIAVCDEWRNDFPLFCRWAKANGYRPEMQIDRIDNNGPYPPNNCRWVSRSVNCLNKRNSRFIVINGETKTISEWAETAGVDYGTFWYRVHAGWRGIELLKPVAWIAFFEEDEAV